MPPPPDVLEGLMERLRPDGGFYVPNTLRELVGSCSVFSFVGPPAPFFPATATLPPLFSSRYYRYSSLVCLGWKEY